MDLQLADKKIAVGGATSGLGRAVAERLIEEGATVIGIARRRTVLEEMVQTHGDKFIPLVADLSDSSAVRALGEQLTEQQLYGCLLNAGGPRTGATLDLSMEDWDEAYRMTLRWKIQLTAALAPGMIARRSGRLLFLESVSIKQPIDNLVLSNSFRAGVAGYVKTISRELGADGITANIISPGYHATSRITSVLEKAAELQHISLEEAKANFVGEVPTGSLGDPADFATLAAYLLSPLSAYITGQTLSVDGGLTRHLTG